MISICCVYPSNFAIDTFLYNGDSQRNAEETVVYILQILQLIHSYTTGDSGWDSARLLCISFKFCNWYIPIQPRCTWQSVERRCVYPSNFAIDTFLYNGFGQSIVVGLLCISFKFCNWYIPIQRYLGEPSWTLCCVYPSNFAIDTFLYNQWI